MFGPKLTTIFASRWKALWWSALVLVTAYCTVPSQEQSTSPERDQQAVQIVSKLTGKQPHESGHRTNPWAK